LTANAEQVPEIGILQKQVPEVCIFLGFPFVESRHFIECVLACDLQSDGLVDQFRAVRVAFDFFGAERSIVQPISIRRMLDEINSVTTRAFNATLTDIPTLSDIPYHTASITLEAQSGFDELDF
jgi:hypothetical protein